MTFHPSRATALLLGSVLALSGCGSPQFDRDPRTSDLVVNGNTIPEVARVFCATANPTEVLVAQTEQGRGILGVVDGFSPKGIEGPEDQAWRKNFLRKIGYKF